MANAFDIDRLRYPAPQPATLPDAVDIEIVADRPDGVEFDPATGTVRIEHSDGTVEIGPAPQDEQDTDDGDHFANLAPKLSNEVLGQIADELLRGIESDDQSRHDWLEVTSRGIEMFGLRIKQPATSQLGGAQLEGTSKVNHPLLKEAVLRFQANARGELLPTEGPVKVAHDGDETETDEILAKALEDDLNHYLTTTATEYYPDTDRLFLFTGFRGCGFKKVYNCPIRRRPVSESIEPENLIVSNAATDLKSCRRVTHRVMMRPSIVRRMQLLGYYREVKLPTVTPHIPNAVDQKKAEVQGIQQNQSIDPRDLDREIFECHCELDVPGYEHTENGKETGLQLPWTVTLDKDSREVLAVRRNWDPDDDQCMSRTTFVKYPYVPGFGFYDIGLLQILGDMTLAATAGYREMLDAGAYSCFPGFLYLQQAGKQLTNEFRVPPGGGLPINIPGINDIRQAIMPLPYSPPNQAMMALIEDVVQTGQRVGGIAELPIGEGKQDAPVGTTLALIEQATKVEAAVFKRLHQAQGEEFQLLKERFMDDPEALWRHNKKSKVLGYLIGQEAQADPSIAANEQEQQGLDEKRKARFLAALEDFNLVPRADPNTSSQMQRIMKMTALVQITMGDPGFDSTAVKKRALETIGIADVDALISTAPPAQPPPDLKGQAAMVSAQAQDKAATAKLADAQTKAQSSQMDNMTESAQAQMKQNVAVIGLAREQVVHEDDQLSTQRQLAQDERQANADRVVDMAKHITSMPPPDQQVFPGGRVE